MGCTHWKRLCTWAGWDLWALSCRCRTWEEKREKGGGKRGARKKKKVEKVNMRCWERKNIMYPSGRAILRKSAGMLAVESRHYLYRPRQPAATHTQLFALHFWPDLNVALWHITFTQESTRPTKKKKNHDKLMILWPNHWKHQDTGPVINRVEKKTNLQNRIWEAAGKGKGLVHNYSVWILFKLSQSNKEVIVQLLSTGRLYMILESITDRRS